METTDEKCEVCDGRGWGQVPSGTRLCPGCNGTKKKTKEEGDGFEVRTINGMAPHADADELHR